jgi:lipoprotein-releasing system ATP-binding protein
MTPLLSLENVSKSFMDGGRRIVVLDGVFLDVDAGVSVGVYGARRSGKSTLLRLAAGIALPDSGAIRFDGRDIARMPSRKRGRLLRREIAFVSATDRRANPSESVVDHVAMSLGSEGVTMREARRKAMRVLHLLEVAESAEEPMGALSLTEHARVLLARALAREPRLLVLDEPALMPNLGDRDRFYGLLREQAREHDMTLLLASEELAALQGASVMMSIADGELLSSEPRGTVVPLPGRRLGGAERSGR